MTVIRQADKEFIKQYQAFDQVQVGPGTDPDMYASPAYAAKKVKDLYIGSLASFVYSGYEHDMMPTAIVLKHVSIYNCVLCVNLNYLPIQTRVAILRYIIKSNMARIKDELPILVDWQALKRAVPPIEGATRLYKLPLIRVNELHPIMEWEEAVKKSGTRWQNHYRKFMRK